MCEGFEVPGFARGDLARAFGDRAQFALLARVERDEAVGFAPVCVAEDDGVNTDGAKVRGIFRLRECKVRDDLP